MMNRETLKVGAVLLFTCIACTGCIGTAIGAATDVVVETAKVPFKVGGAVVDVATGDDDDKE